MSLKAKLEAVIYAAEEPVTLAQLAALFRRRSPGVESGAGGCRRAAAGGGGAAKIAGAAAHARRRDCSTWAWSKRPISTTAAEAAPVNCRASGSAPPLKFSRHRSAVSLDGQSLQVDLLQPNQRGLRTRKPKPSGWRGCATAKCKAILRQAARRADRHYAPPTSGAVEIREIAGGYRMATKPECHDAVRLFIKSLKPALKLSLPALETLAVVAYKQPVTAPEVNEIRGVESAGVLGLAAQPQAYRHGRPQAGDRPAHPLQNHARNSCSASASRTSPSCLRWKSSKRWPRSSSTRCVESRGRRRCDGPDGRGRDLDENAPEMRPASSPASTTSPKRLQPQDRKQTASRGRRPRHAEAVTKRRQKPRLLPMSNDRIKQPEAERQT